MRASHRLLPVTCAVLLLAGAAGCAKKYEKAEESLSAPVHCATAEGDLRALQNEKAHVAQQLAMGATMITPAGFVVSILTGSAGTKYDMLTGDYNKKIDERIALIKSTCKIQ